MFVFVCVRVAQTYDVDGNGSIDVQEFSGLIRDPHTTGKRSRNFFTNRTPKCHIHNCNPMTLVKRDVEINMRVKSPPTG